MPPELGGAIGNPGSTRNEFGPPALTKPQPELTAPALPPTDGGSTLSEGATFVLRSVVVEGASSIPTDELTRLADPYLGKSVSTSDLEELRRLLTGAYVQRGFINSGAVLPDQQVSSGVITYRIVEGRVTGYGIEGLKHLHPSYVQERLALGAGPPLNINVLSERMQTLLNDVNLSRLNVDIEPGGRPGEATLDVRVDETKQWSFAAAVANNSAPAVGAIRGEINVTARSLTGYGDIASLTYGRTEGVDDWSASWAIPITKWDTLLSFRYDHNAALVIEDLYRALDIESRTETERVAIAQPVYRTGNQNLTVGLAFEHRSSKNFLLDEPFSFGPGEVDGASRASIFRIYADWLDRRTASVTALRATLSFGVPILDATEPAEGPSGEFQSLLLQAQYVRRVHNSWQLILKGDLQLAAQPLYSFEQFAIGGLETVRGYRTNELVRDNGAIASAELRIPVAHLPLPGMADTEGATLQIAPFMDFGEAWNSDRPTPRPQDIGSVGLGLRWDVPSRVRAGVYYAIAYRHLHPNDRDLQDSGVHFSVSILY